MILSSFGGIVPRLADHKLALNQATIAHDVRLRDGIIEAWREPCQHQDAVPGARSFYLYGCCLASWTDNVSAAELTPDWGRFFITGRNCTNGLETVVVDKCCNLFYKKVGMPAPLQPPVADAAETCSTEADARSYVYTFMNAWGEESAPSPASNIVRVDDGATVTVSNIQAPGPDDDVAFVILYRSSTGFRQADGKIQKPLTEYLECATLTPGTTTFTDNVQAIYLAGALETQYDRPPPEGLSQLVSIGDQVRLAGCVKNRLYFSENHEPHNWPAKYDLTLDYHIVHIRSMDQRLYVTTDSIPYIIDVSSCDDTKCIPVTSLEKKLPDIGCHYLHGAIMTPHGMMYASPFGIILLSPDASWHILTSRWFGEKEWLKLRPDTIRMAYWEGYLFFTTDMGSFLLNIDGDPYGDMKGAELTTLSDFPVDMDISNTGKLILLQNDKTWVWDGGVTYRPYVWKSRRMMFKDLEGRSQPESSGAVRGVMWWPSSVKLGGVTHVTITDSHGHEIFSRLLGQEKPRRIKHPGRHLWYQVEMRGTEPVEFISLGTATQTVNRGE